MSDYVVSAIKYRPQCFDDVVGQKALTSTLIGAIRSGKLAHSYLFCGPRGVGKTTCARIFAKTINCEHLNSEGEACNECDSCKAFNDGRSMNVHEIDAASNNSVDNIRNLIEQVQIPPQMGKYKIFIIDEVHMLSPGAFNAFLKTLEEPPSYAIFILATTEKQKIIPTILSRCQIYDFKRIEADDIVYQLKKIANKESFTFEEEALRVIAEKADGGMRDALSLFDQQAVYTNGNITYEQVIKNLNILDHSAYFRIYESLIAHNIPQVLFDFNEVVARGFDGRDFIDGLARHTRNLMMAQDARTLPLLQVSKHTVDQYRAQSQKCKPQYLYKVMRLCSDCSLKYRDSRNKQLLVEITLIEAAQADDDSDGHAGKKSQAKVLKNIFSKLPPQIKTASDGAQQTVENPTQATNHTQVASTTTPQPAEGQTTAVAADRKETKQKVHTLNVMSITSIMTGAKKENEPIVSTGMKTSQEQSQIVQEKPANAARNFDATQLYGAWLEFSQNLPTAYNDLAARMKAMRPEVDENCKVSVKCENPLVAKYMQEIVPQMQDTLRKTLNNSDIIVEIKITEDFSATINPIEEFKKLTVENKCLAKLNETLQFEML